MARARARVLLAAAALVLAGCSAQPSAPEGGAPTAEPTQSVQVGAATPTPSPESGSVTPPRDASVDPAEPKDGRLKIGETYTSEVAELTVTAIKKDIHVSFSSKLTTAVNVKFCLIADVDNVAIASLPWTLVDDDFGLYTTYQMDPVDGLPSPTYPEFVRVRKGDCAKGWMYFEHPSGTKFTELRYDTDSGDSARWKL